MQTGIGPAVSLLVLTHPNLRGDDVRQVQERLKEQGFQLDADGIFGTGTQLAVTDFQTRQGLEADGIVGSGTRRALGL